MAKRVQRKGVGGNGGESPRSSRSRAVGEIMPDVGRAAFRRFGFVQSAVVSRWGEIVGPQYARVSAPESIRFPAGKRADGLLTLAVESAHAPTMQHVAPTIIERVNRFFGYSAVARLQLRQGMVRRPGANATPAPVGVKSVELGDSLRAIADPELRACLEALAEGVGRSSGTPLIALPVGRIG